MAEAIGAPHWTKLDQDEQLREQHREHLERIITLYIQHTSPEVSGVVVEPEIGFSGLQYKNAATGLLMSLEKKTSTINPTALPSISPDWGIEHIRNNYGLVKLELYYHPQELENVRKKQFVAEVFDFCTYEGIDLLLELLVYHPLSEEPKPEVLYETQLQAATEFAPFCNLLALEYLESPFAAATLTAQLDTPWVYSARETGYEAFKQNLRAAMQSGARGFLAGDPFWFGAEIAQALAVGSLQETQEHCIKGSVRDRVIEATRIATEEQLAAAKQIV